MKKIKSLISLIFALMLLLSTALSGVSAKSAEEIILINGVSVIIHEPPSDFNPLTASDEELAYYFYPARPKDPGELKEWEKNVNFKWVRPQFAQGELKDEKSGLPLDIQFSTTLNNGNYAGYAKQSSARRVAGSWTVPTITAATTNRPAYSAQWIGLGGIVSGEPLLQAGTVEEITSTGTVNRRVFYEILNTNLNSAPIYLTNISISAGDTFYADLNYITSTNGSYSDSSLSMSITNVSQGTGTNFSTAFITTWNKALSTAEWVLERPTIAGSLYTVNLANGNTTFSGAKWSSTASGTLSDITDTTTTLKLVMKNEAQTVTLASPGSISSGGNFSTTWSNYK